MQIIVAVSHPVLQTVSRNQEKASDREKAGMLKDEQGRICVRQVCAEVMKYDAYGEKAFLRAGIGKGKAVAEEFAAARKADPIAAGGEKKQYRHSSFLRLFI